MDRVDILLVVGLLISISLITLFLFEQKSGDVTSTKTFYGFDGRIHNQQGDLVAIYEPIMNHVRPATLSDKFFYGEMN